MSFSDFPCVECYQDQRCEMSGDPIYVVDALNGADTIPPGSPEDCFYHVCRAGVFSALTTMRNARDSGSAGLFPFGTDHKPFIRDNGEFSGRFVAVNAQPLGFCDGDVVLRSSAGNIFLTNVLNDRPPRHAPALNDNPPVIGT